jgi:serine/threonine protein kinase
MAQSEIDALAVDPLASEPPSGLFGGPSSRVFLKPLERLGDYRILRELGRGGMGIVYEAEQVSLGRHVALKVLATPSLLGPKHIERFHREAKAAARLHHTNIVPVFGVGEQDGLHYYVMQYIEGKGLDLLLGRLRTPAATQTLPPPRSSDAVVPAVTVVCQTPLDGEDANFAVTAAPCPAPTPPPLSPIVSSGKMLPDQMKPRHFQRAARIALQVAEALQYAHEQGILHRDIKPSNLLVESAGTVWVLDFGLAKLMEQDDLTQPGEIGGTLRFAPPERFQGKSDARSDIYSLGLTLYEILTLRSAFDDADHATLLHKVMHEEPPPPRSLNPFIPRDLETVLLKAIARDPVHRYQTAGALADDLRRFLEDKPVTARRVRSLERLWRWCRRNPVVAGLTATAATLLLLVAVVATVGYAYTQGALNREEQQRKEAEKQRVEADDQRRRAEANLGLSLEAFEEIFNSVTQQRMPQPVEEGVEDGVEPPFHPNVSPEVAALLDKLLHFYDQFGEQNSADPNLQRDAVRAHKRVGDLQQRLGQWEKAEAAFRRALELYRKYGDAFPNEMLHRREMAATCNELGAVYMMTGRLKEAENAHRQALTILLEPPQTNLTVFYRFEKVRTYNDLGHVLWKEGRILQAGENLKLGLDLLGDLLKDDPKNPSYRLTEAQSYRQLALIFGARNLRKEEADTITQAILILEELDQEFPLVPDYRYELSETYAMLDTNLRSPQLRKEAEKRFQRAVDLAKDLTQRYPNVPEYQASLARSQRKLGTALRSAGKWEEAEKAFRSSVSTQHSLAERFPKVPDYVMFLAESQLSLGELFNERGRYVDAKAVLEESIKNQETYPANDRNLYARRLQVNQYQVMEETLTHLGDKFGAEEMRKKANEIRQQMRKDGKG